MKTRKFHIALPLLCLLGVLASCQETSSTTPLSSTTSDQTTSTGDSTLHSTTTSSSVTSDSYPDSFQPSYPTGGGEDITDNPSKWTPSDFRARVAYLVENPEALAKATLESRRYVKPTTAGYGTNEYEKTDYTYYLGDILVGEAENRTATGTMDYSVDPDSGYLVKGAWWGSPMNHIVLRYADVLLMRAEALIQLDEGGIDEAMSLINQVRNRAKQSMSMISNYEKDYGVKIKIEPYSGTFTKDEALKRLKFERRLELAMESDRFFDLVRWGEAETVLNDYYAAEADNCTIYSSASFTPDKNEYLPIPFAQISASNGHYTQNIGNW